MKKIYIAGLALTVLLSGGCANMNNMGLYKINALLSKESMLLLKTNKKETIEFPID